LLFHQCGGLTQSNLEAGIEMNLEFFLGILNALNSDDVINEAAHAIRPYQVQSGATDQAIHDAMELLAHHFHTRIADSPAMGSAARFIRQLRDRAYTDSLRNAASTLNA